MVCHFGNWMSVIGAVRMVWRGQSQMTIQLSHMKADNRGLSVYMLHPLVHTLKTQVERQETSSNSDYQASPAHLAYYYV